MRIQPTGQELPQQRDQNDDRNRYAQNPQENGTHDCLRIRCWREPMSPAVVHRTSRRRLATNAPTNSDTTSHNASSADALRASSATCFALAAAWSRVCFSRVNVSVTRCSASACPTPVFAATSWPRYCRSAIRKLTGLERIREDACDLRNSVMLPWVAWHSAPAARSWQVPPCGPKRNSESTK